MARRPLSRSLPSTAALPLSCLSLHALLHGHRPSEAVALRVRSLALGSGTLFVERSRSLGAEAAPKTAAAARVVRLTPRNVELLRQLIELRAEPADYVFKNTLGEPIDQRSFYKIFCSAQRADRHPHPRTLRDKGHLRLDGTDSRSQPRVAFRADGCVGCDTSSALWEVHPRRGG